MTAHDGELPTLIEVGHDSYEQRDFKVYHWADGTRTLIHRAGYRDTYARWSAPVELVPELSEVSQ